MGSNIIISSINYSGQIADITYYPDLGGTIPLGSQVLPYQFEADYYFGSYELYFPFNGQTCYSVINNPDTNYLLQENYSTLDQENNFKILIT